MTRIIRLFQSIAPPAESPSAPTPDAAPRLFVPGQSPGTLRGTATVYNALSSDQGGYVIRILPGAFANSIAKRTIFACWQHNESEIIASTKNGTLRLQEDKGGLRIELDVAPTGRGYDTFALVGGNYLGEMSIGFAPVGVKFKVEKQADGSKITIEEVSSGILYECSVVSKGAMPGTSIKAVGGTGLSAAPRNDRERIASHIRQIERFASLSRPTSSREQIAASIRKLKRQLPAAIGRG